MRTLLSKCMIGLFVCMLTLSISARDKAVEEKNVKVEKTEKSAVKVVEKKAADTKEEIKMAVAGVNEKAAPVVDLKKVIAEVNGQKLTGADLELTKKVVCYSMRRPISSVPEAQMPMLDQMAKNTLIAEKILLAYAKKAEVSYDKSVLEMIKKRMNEDPKAAEQLSAFNLSKEELLGYFTTQLKIEALVEKWKGSMAVSDEDMKAFYEENKDKFKASVRASHILIKTDPKDTEEQKAEKLAKLKELKAKITAGEDFAKLAAENSDCPSKARGGDLDFFEKGKMVPAFENAAFAMEVGDVSDVVTSSFGYHLIKVTDEKRSMKDFQEEIADALKDQQITTKIEEGKKLFKVNEM